MKKHFKRNVAGRLLSLTLAASFAFQSPLYAAADTWSKDEKGWMFTEDTGKKITGRWLEYNGNRYLIGADGYMKTGWQLENGVWYFFNLSGNTAAPEGAALKGWQWIDGKCYYFEPNGTDKKTAGSMYANEVTPDGFTVNADGQWTENGSIVSVAGKGIFTTAGPAGGNAASTATAKKGGGGGGGGGGSSSGGGGGHSSGSGSSSGSHSSGSNSSSGNGSNGSASDNANSGTNDPDVTPDVPAPDVPGKDDETPQEESGSYTIYYLDEKGNILKTVSGSDIYGRTIIVDELSFDGYTYETGAGEKAFTKETQVFTVQYKKIEQADDEKEEKIQYRFLYVDAESGEEIGYTSWRTIEKYKTVTWKTETIKGYRLAAGNNLTKTAVQDKDEFTILFDKEDTADYRITWRTADGTVLKKITGTGKVGETIEVPDLNVTDYVQEDGLDDIELSDGKNEYVITCKYAGEASPSELTAYVNYSLIFEDFDTKKVLRKEEGKIEKGEEIEPDWCPEGYDYASEEYSFTASEEKNEFKVELLKQDIELEDEVTIVSYSAVCEDDEQEVISEFEGSATVSGDSTSVTVEHAVKGYRQTGDTEFDLSAAGDNLITLTYEQDTDSDTDEEIEMDFTVRLVDITTMELIREDVIKAARGEYLDFTDYEVPEGYEPAGVFPSEIRVSAESANNKTTLYLIKTKETEDDVKYANWTVRYVNYDNPDEEVLPSQTGSSRVGKFPVYFNKEYKIGKKLWRAVDSSPRTFTLKDNTDMNVFTVRFKLVSEDADADQLRTYALRYIANDTGSVLGISVGEANVGTILPLRNSWSEYMYAGNDTYTVADEDNEADIYFDRNTVGQPDKNDHTDDYDGYEFLAVFTDQNGDPVFDPVRGKVRSGDTFYIDYPDVVERDGVVYRADKKSPFKTAEGGTSYRQFEINYTKGEASDSRLEQWLKIAQDAKNDFYGTTPYRYAVNFKEYGSWNDIGLYVGVAPKGSEVDINSVDIPGWIRRSHEDNSFTLSSDGMIVRREYDKVTDTPSTYDYEREYTIRFQDTDGNNLFDPYTGRAAFSRMNQTIDFYTYFPRTFTDAGGNRWRTDAKIPQDFVLRCNNDSNDNIHTVTYYKVFDNAKTEFFVENDQDVRNYISDIGSYLYDTELHDFYLIGKNYNPQTAVVSETLYSFNLTGYQGAVEDTFDMDGVTYRVFHFRLSRLFAEETCDHEWEYVEELPGNCYVAEQTTVQCRKCKKTQTVYKGALGHIDYDYDRVCDVCGEQLKIEVGDSITVNWNGGEYYGGKTKSMEFACIGRDEDGNLVLMAEENLNSDIYGTYAEDGKGYFSTSTLHAFLNDGFADGLSVKRNLVNRDGNLVTILSREEYDAYKAAAGGTYIFPDGTFLLKDEEEDTVLTTAGKDSIANADNYGVRPVIHLPDSSADVGAEGGAWAVDDLQVRKIGNKIWLFRCVDENYEDSSATPKHLALFLCDSVIPSNYEMGFGIDEDEDHDGKQETRFFGTADNNYKYSILAEYLKESTQDTGDLIWVNVGVKNEYSGETKKGAWNRLQASDLTAHKRSTAQVFYSDIFIPSVEEAIAMKDYLFKFNGSDKNNADEIVNNYRRGYFLRTPEYGTTDRVYYVDLVTGRISTTRAVAESYDDVCEVGIRPAYVVEQFE